MLQVSFDSYLKIKEGVQLHVTPSGAKVSIPPAGSTLTVRYAKSSPVAEVNETARELLLQCDGTRTLKMIIQSLASNRSDNEYKQMIDGCVAFIKQAVEYGILSVCQTPNPTQIDITGSPEYCLPQHASIELTSDCNLKCIYCYRNAGPQQAARLPGDVLLNIIEQLAQHGVQIVELTGGEPLLHPRFLQILDFCAQHFRLVAVLSNGCLINENTVERLVAYRDHVVIQIDLDGSTADKHDSLRGVPGAFERTRRGLTLLTREGIRTRVAMNVIPATLDDVENTLALAKSLGATWFTFSPILPIGRAEHLDLLYTLEQAKFMSDLFQQLREKYGTFFSQPTPDQLEELNNAVNCGAGHRSIVVGPTGKLRPCLMLPEEYLAIGDLTTQSVAEVFSSPVTVFLHDLKYPRPEVCKGCRYERFCRYCFTRAVLIQANLQNPCPWALENRIADWFALGAAPVRNTTRSSCPEVFR